MKKSKFKDSLKALQADIHLANLLALDCLRKKDGSYLQMRLFFIPAAAKVISLFHGADVKFAGAMGLIKIMIYMAYPDGKNSMFVSERKASLREFYDVIFPSLLQLQGGIMNVEDKERRELCAIRYRKKNELDKGKYSVFDLEREEECGICMEKSNMIVLPDCCHSMCLNCYQNWCWQSCSCPFCRDSLEEVNSNSLWVYVDKQDVVDYSTVTKENQKRLLTYIVKLPLLDPDPLYAPYNSVADAYIR